MIRKLFLVMTVAAFVFSVTMAMAAEQTGMRVQSSPAKAQKSVNCCLKGECKSAASPAQCTAAGGKVVKDCKDCK
jgi:hypothetical protein